MKSELKKIGYIIETLDMGSADEYEKVIFIDVPDKKKLPCDLNIIKKEYRILILLECSMIYTNNSSKKLFEDFGMVYTYDDELVKECGYKKSCCPNEIVYHEVKEKTGFALLLREIKLQITRVNYIVKD